MEELYSDLENYNEVYTVEELRNENKQLKLKLEEYETAMGKLQKSLLQDYDMLALEFQNLQTNYSSLLKTARAEIERKTQIITKLNHDIDMKVLQSGGNRKSIHKNKFKKGPQNPYKTVNVQTSNIGTQNLDIDRRSSALMSTSVPSSNNTKINTADKVVKSVDACIDKENFKESNENISQCDPRHKDASKLNLCKKSYDDNSESTNNTVPTSDNIKLNVLDKVFEMVNAHSSNKEGLEGKVSPCDPKHKDTHTGKNNLRHRTRSAHFDTAETGSVSTNFSAPSSVNRKLHIVDEVVERVEACINKEDIKENVSECDSKHKDIRTHANRLHHRRKSVHVDTFPKFSSDEESGSEKYMRRNIRNDIPPTNISLTKDINSVVMSKNNERPGTRTSEPSSIVGRSFDYQEEASRLNRYCDNGRYRDNNWHRDNGRNRRNDRTTQYDRFKESDWTRDRHRESIRNRVSDRYRENDRYWESDNYRCRDKNDTYKHRRHNSPDRPYKRSYREHQEDYYRSGRHKPEFSDLEAQGHYAQRNYDQSLKGYRERSLGQSHDVPNSKRQKLDAEIHMNKYQSYQDNEPNVMLAQTHMHEYDMPRISCQSPDVAHILEPNTDAIPVHTIREIKLTASVPLDDPRTTSKKYILKTENGKSTLCTSVSQNTHIKPVDKSLWNIKTVAIPDALLQQPQPDFTDDNIKDIYMSLKEFEPNEYIESAKTSCDSEDIAFKNAGEKAVDETLKESDFSINESSKQLLRNEHVAGITPDNTIAQVELGSETVESMVPNMAQDLPKIISDEHNTDADKTQDTNLNLPCIDIHNDNISTNKSNENPCDHNKGNHSHIINMAIVREDLELSDETSDNLELHKNVLEEKATVSKQLPIMETKLIDPSCITKLGSDVITQTITDCKFVNKKGHDKSKESDSHKKHKNKRKKLDSKDLEIEEIRSIGDNKKSKKVKSSTKQIKKKFSDLFGDSGSLITPEDLGIPVSCDPLCEDAQDAVDVHVKENINHLLPRPGNEETCSNMNIIYEESTDNANQVNPNKENIKAMKEKIPTLQLNTNIYQNFNNESTKADVVKTVIISSGIQPQFIMGDRNENIVKRVADVEVNIQNIDNCFQAPADAVLKKHDLMKALATSTPHKEIATPKAIETDYSINDCVSNSNISKSDVSENRTASDADQSNTNTQDCHDPPDVRIFVRRRKKPTKRN